MRRRLVPALTLILVLAACGDDDTPVAAADDGAPAVVEVALEETTAFFTEGFELSVRFEDAAGGELATVDWTEFVQSQGSEDLEAFYESVLTREVPAGAVRVVSTMEIGMSGGPFEPCTVELDVAEGETARVVLAFDGTCAPA